MRSRRNKKEEKCISSKFRRRHDGIRRVSRNMVSKPAESVSKFSGDVKNQRK